MTSSFLVHSVSVFHQVVVFFIYLGCLLPKKVLPYHIGFIVLLYVHWKTNHNKCALTQWEWKLRGLDHTQSPTIEYDHENPFMDKLFQQFHLHLTSKQLHQITMYGIIVSLLISIIRLLN